MGEWSLIIFTIALQAAVGLFLWTAITSLKYERTFGKTVSLTAFVLTAVAVLGSLTHLGIPLRALNSLLNLGSSWLSKEILLTAAFFGVALITLLLEIYNPKMAKPFYWVGAVVGLIGIFSMSMIYVSSIIPAWTNWYTVADFILTSIILGGGLFLVIASLAKSQVKGAAIGILSLILLQAVITPSYIAFLGVNSEATNASLRLMLGDLQLIFYLKWIFISLGAVLFIFGQGRKDELNYLSFALTSLAIGLIIGRFVFYAIGIPLSLGLM